MHSSNFNYVINSYLILLCFVNKKTPLSKNKTVIFLFIYDLSCEQLVFKKLLINENFDFNSLKWNQHSLSIIQIWNISKLF